MSVLYIDDERVSKSDKCLKCGEIMTTALQESSIIRRCICGYSSVEVTGESKLAYNEARLGNIRILQRHQ